MQSRRLMSLASLTVALTVGASTLLGLTGCSSKSEDTGSGVTGAVGGPAKKAGTPTASSAAQPGDPIEGAKAAMEKMAKAKGLSDVADSLTNASAAALSIPMLLVVGMMAGMEDMANQAKAQAPGGAPGGVKNEIHIKADFEAFAKKYDLDMKKGQPDDAAMQKMESRGREMLSDLSAMLTKLDKTGKMSQPMTNSMPKTDDLKFTVISPTEVKIEMKDPSKTPKDMPKGLAAKFEDGAWRIHIGNIKEVMEQMKQANPMGGGPMGGAPGMGGPPMGAPPMGMNSMGGPPQGGPPMGGGAPK